MKKKIVFLLLIIVVIFSGCVGKLSNIELKLTEPKEDRQLNDKQVQQYRESFGIVNDKLKQRFIGVYTSTEIRGVYGDNYRTWIRAYELRAPFMERSFEVWVDNRTHKIFGDNFYEVLIWDNKFQHLYSEWVKRQVGIDDEDVELEFDEAKQDASLVGDRPYIDFDKIISLDNLEEQICENTHNLYLRSIDKKIVNIETKDNWLQISKMIKDEYIKKANDINLSLIWDNKVAVKLYFYDVDLANDNRYNHIGLNKNDMNFYYILFNLQDNNIKYFTDFYDRTGATVLQNWLKEIDN